MCLVYSLGWLANPRSIVAYFHQLMGDLYFRVCENRRFKNYERKTKFEIDVSLVSN